MNITSASYESIKDLPSISLDGIEDRDDAPIGLFPQLFEFYKWVQQSGIWEYRSRDIIIPDKISWDGMTKSWENISSFYNKKEKCLSLLMVFNSPEIGKYTLCIKLLANSFDDTNDLTFKFKFTEKDILDLSLIEKHIEKCQQFCDEMDQIYNDRQRACDEVLARYK